MRRIVEQHIADTAAQYDAERHPDDIVVEIADGQVAQLTSALDSGRRAGLVSLNHVLLSLVKGGTVDASEAYRKADNRSGLVALLEHDGVDTSLLARLA